jgi:hypothetical protein
VRLAKEIGDPQWQDIEDRDNLIEELANALQAEVGRPPRQVVNSQERIAVGEVLRKAQKVIDGSLD